MKVIYPPSSTLSAIVSLPAPSIHNVFTVFLAGSIEQGIADNWQDKLIDLLKDEPDTLILLNPRRHHWDPTWKQSIKNPVFVEQVEWELDNIDAADMVIFYFDPNTKSPITLMELGLVSGMGTKEVAVCCPKGFWRKGNVDIICDMYGVKQVKTAEKLANRIKKVYNKWQTDKDPLNT